MDKDKHAISAPPTPGQYGLLLADIRGFTAITSQYPILSLVPLLNHFFEKMSIIIDKHGGTIDKFMGDSVLALFAVRDDTATALAMLSCAVDMQIAMDEVNRFGHPLGLPTIYMGIGLTMGTAVVCTLGSEIYRERTVLGEAVNFVSRIASFTVRGQVLLSATIQQLTSDHLELGNSFDVGIKGLRSQVTVYELLGLRFPVLKTIPVRENRRSPRVNVVLPISYQLIQNQKLVTPAVKADIMDLSYGGMRIFTPTKHNTLDEIKIDISVGLTGNKGGELYAKVLRCTEQDSGNFWISTEFSYIEESVRESIRSLVDYLAQSGVPTI
jgi:adenylate cyclase